MIPDSRSERRLALQEGRRGDASAAAGASRKRQRDWIERKDPKTWQRRQRHMASAYEVLNSLDNTLRVSCGWPSGLKALEVTPEMETSVPPMAWRHLTVCCDRGSDGWSGLGFLERKLGLNITRIPDQIHDVTNDVQLAIKRSGMQTHCILQQSVWNLVHGPWGQDTRFRQAVEAMQDVFELDSPAEMPLWRRFAHRILEDLGWGDKAGEEGIEELLWQRCKEDSPFRVKSGKEASSRFMGYIKRSIYEEPFWNQRAFSYTYLALEMGWLKGAAFEKLIMPLDANLGPLEDASKMVRGQAADEALVRKSCRNIVVLAVFFLDNPDNQARQRILTKVGRVWLPWHSLQNKQLRRAGHSGPWLQQEIGGRFLSFCSRTWSQLSENLEQSGILTTFAFFEARVEGPPPSWTGQRSRERTSCVSCSAPSLSSWLQRGFADASGFSEGGRVAWPCSAPAGPRSRLSSRRTTTITGASTTTRAVGRSKRGLASAPLT